MCKAIGISALDSLPKTRAQQVGAGRSVQSSPEFTSFSPGLSPVFVGKRALFRQPDRHRDEASRGTIEPSRLPRIHCRAGGVCRGSLKFRSSERVPTEILISP